MSEGFVPPAEVRANAKRGLELREKHGRGGTEAVSYTHLTLPTNREV